MASSDNAIEKDALHDWVEEETRALDVVASWETLCDVYRTLEFSDPLSDAMRLEEFKWIIAEMNKHLTRARDRLMKCPDPESMIEALNKMFTSTGAKVSNRMDLTYHKLRQIWITRMRGILETRIQMEKEDRIENGREDFWNE